MIHIREDGPERLVIETPRTVLKVQGAIFTVIGLIPTVAIALDPETVIFTAIMPFLIFVAGIVLFVISRKPDYLIVDKAAETVHILISEGVFSRTPEKRLTFDEIGEMQYASSSGSLGGGYSAKKTEGVDFILRDGTKVQATVYVSRKKKAREAYEAMRIAIGK